MDVSDLFRVESENTAAAGGDEAADAEATPAEPDGVVVLHVHVQPGAGRSAVVGRHGTSLKVRVAAAPEGGRANEACVALLAETFGVKAAAVEITSGATSRSKQFRLTGVDVEEFRRQLERAVAGELDVGSGGRGNRPAGKR